MEGDLEPQQLQAINAILDWQDDDIDAAARYLLLRVYTIYGTEPMKETVEELSGKVGLSAAVVIRSRDRLLEKGIFAPVKVLSRSKKQVGAMLAGRRRAGFRIDEQFLQRLIAGAVEKRGRSTPGPIRAAALQNLFCGHVRARQKQPRRGRPGGQADQLSPDNRVLLGTLWALADEYGVVRDLGGSSLGRLSGLSSTQVRNQLAKLQRLDYILKRVSGASCKGAFGKAEGSIVLNVFRPEYGAEVEKIARFQAIVSSGDVFRAHMLADKLRKSPVSVGRTGEAPEPTMSEQDRYSEDAQKLMDLALRANPHFGQYQRAESSPERDVDRTAEEIEKLVWEGFPRLDGLLLDDCVGPAIRYIRAKLALYAADILNAAKDPSAFDKLDYEKAPDEVVTRIRREAVTPRMQAFYDEPELSAIVALFYGWGWHLAREVMLGTARALGQAGGNRLARGHFVVLPVRSTDRVEVLFFKERVKPDIAPIGKPGSKASPPSIQQG